MLFKQDSSLWTQENQRFSVPQKALLFAERDLGEKTKGDDSSLWKSLLKKKPWEEKERDLGEKNVI